MLLKSCTQYTLENIARVIKNGQSRGTGNIGYGTQDDEKHTQYVFDTTIRKQTQIT